MLLQLDYNIYFDASIVALSVYFVIALKQLFGYGIWGTFWRIAVVFGFGVYMLSSLFFIPFDIDLSAYGDDPLISEFGKFYFVFYSALLAFLVLGIGWVVNLVVTRKSRARIYNKV